MAEQSKSFSAPEETRNFPNGKLEVVRIGGITAGKGTFQPGWRWSEHVKPIAGTASCQSNHIGYQLSGQMGIRLDNGTEFVCKPGEAFNIPAGHDGWTIGNEPAVVLDFSGFSTYAKPS
jgi:hypothetical protein